MSMNLTIFFLASYTYLKVLFHSWFLQYDKKEKQILLTDS